MERRVLAALMCIFFFAGGVFMPRASAQENRDDRTGRAAADKPKLGLRHFIANARVCLDANFGEGLPEDADIKALVRKADGSPVKVNAVMNLTPGGLGYGSLDVKKLAPGKYDVVVTVTTKDGRVFARTSVESFERTEPEEWMTNTYGKEDIVIQGFKPLKAEGLAVALWGRRYDFGNAVMPVQITNQGREMLARPINWFVRMAGPDYPLRTKEMNLISATETRAVYKAKGAIGPISVTADIIVEYDGFMKFDITFDPGTKPVTVKKLWMDIPLVPAQCTNFFHPTRRSGAWEETGWSMPLKLTLSNAVTLGTPDISLQWITESDEHFYPREHKEALQAFEDKGARVFRVNVISQPKRVSKPFTLVFALHAGPVRPRPAGWRGWTMSGRRYLDPERHTSVQYNYFHGWWSRAPGDLIPRKGPDGGPAVKLKDRIDGASMLFCGFRHFTEKDPEKRLPEWEKYEKEWQRVPVEIMVGSAPGWNQQSQDLNSSWSQWHVYTCYKLFSATGFRGLYYDSMHAPAVSMNEGAGSGYVDEKGVRHPTSPIFSLRETQRRVYAIVKHFRPDDGIVIIHTASTIQLPVVSFCDIIYDGEIMGWLDLVPPGGNYFETFRNDFFQMIFSCKNYGPVGGFHDMTASPNYDKPGVSRAIQMVNQRKLWAKWLMHDIHTYGGSTSGMEELLYFWLDNSFDIADPQVKFHSYWQPNPAVKVLRGYWAPIINEQSLDRASRMWAVAYSKPGAVLVIVVRDAPNNYDGDITVEVQLDRKQLGLPDGPLKSFELETLGRTEKGVLEGDILKVPVRVDDFSALIIKPATTHR